MKSGQRGMPRGSRFGAFYGNAPPRMSENANPNAQPLDPELPVYGDVEALPTGTRLAEFEIKRVLGRGGFGIVYLASDLSLERHVAIKEYLPAALATRGADARLSVRNAAFAETFGMGLRSFVNESRLLARFDHPSLVKVHRFWEANGTAYMVMPYYEGVTLTQVRLSMSEPPAEAWLRRILAGLLGALEVMHDASVFHRDVAPDNIVLLASGAAGAARLRRGAPCARRPGSGDHRARQAGLCADRAIRRRLALPPRPVDRHLRRGSDAALLPDRQAAAHRSGAHRRRRLRAARPVARPARTCARRALRPRLARRARLGPRGQTAGPPAVHRAMAGGAGQSGGCAGAPSTRTAGHRGDRSARQPGRCGTGTEHAERCLCADPPRSEGHGHPCAAGTRRGASEAAALGRGGLAGTVCAGRRVAATLLHHSCAAFRCRARCTRAHAGNRTLQPSWTRRACCPHRTRRRWPMPTTATSSTQRTGLRPTIRPRTSAS